MSSPSAPTPNPFSQPTLYVSRYKIPQPCSPHGVVHMPSTLDSLPQSIGEKFRGTTIAVAGGMWLVTIVADWLQESLPNAAYLRALILLALAYAALAFIECIGPPDMPASQTAVEVHATQPDEELNTYARREIGRSIKANMALAVPSTLCFYGAIELWRIFAPHMDSTHVVWRILWVGTSLVIYFLFQFMNVNRRVSRVYLQCAVETKLPPATAAAAAAVQNEREQIRVVSDTPMRAGRVEEKRAHVGDANSLTVDMAAVHVHRVHESERKRE